MTCPGCGRQGKPDAITVRRIMFYNCPACDFSTWDESEYKTDCVLCSREIEPAPRFFTATGAPRHMLCEERGDTPQK